MRTPFGTAARLVAGALTAAMAAVGLTLAGVSAPALADSAPADPGTATTVAADALPTVQIDGVAWSQAVLGGTVYVAGEFTTARPAGSAPGTNTVTRSNLLAYDLESGVLLPWAPVLDAPAYVITASLDGTQLYVGGDFSRVNGAAQNRFAVLDPTTGQQIPGFTTGANAAVRAITSTPSTIFIGGNFNTVAGNDRPRLAAINATTGALLSWRVSAQSAQVEALTLSPDYSRLIVGGRFTMLNGVEALGLGAVTTSNGAVLPFAANQLITNYGFDAGITSLATDGELVYGTGYAFLGDNGGYGNLEGAFAADPMTGNVRWIEDCHGDSYSVFANPGGDSVYVAGHPHSCDNIAGFPEVSPRVHHYGVAFSKTDAMTINPNNQGGYFDFQGNRAPALLNFFPNFTRGAFTGQNQAGWNVTGNSEYVLYGGEFLAVNGTGQQGLVRMAVSSKAPNKQGPQLSGTATTPTAQSHVAGTAQVSWPTNWDPDNETLTYRVLRDGATMPVYTTTAKSTFWQLPRLSFTDSAVSGGSHTYRVQVTDPFGNSALSPAVSVSVAAGPGSLSAYAREVLDDNPIAYWRLGDGSGAAQDWTSYADASVGTGVTRAVTGALSADTDRAARFTGSSSSRAWTTRSSVGLNRLSVEAWIRTTSTTGGKIVGFGSSASASDSSSYDRHLYMGASGKLVFGAYPNTTRTIETPAAYNDGQWHHVVATLGATGMQLYVDGALHAERADTVSGQTYNGYWRIGGDTLGAWPGAAGSNFVGDIDEVAVYGRALTAGDVTVHYGTGTSGTVPNLPPVASFTATGGVLSASVDAGASSDPDGSIASYAWNFGDGSTGTGVTATRSYATPGTYTVTLTVTDDDGATTSTSRQVEAQAPNAVPEARFTATSSGLVLSVDAAGTTDADGTISSYAWDFGDGTTGSGVTASRTFAASGTYSVVLTVTDNRGGTATTTKAVTVEQLPDGFLASDAFARTVATGFGAAPVGGAWTTTAGSTSVSAGQGVLVLAGANSSSSARLAGATGIDVTTQVTERWDKRPNGSGGSLLVRGRITSGGEYRLKVGHKSSGAVSARLVRTNAAGTETALTAEVTVPGVTYTAGTPLIAKIEVTGTSPTTLKAKVWAAAQAEPAGWFVQSMDATAALQGAGHTGLAVLASSSVSNGPVTVRVDDFSVRGPGGTPTSNAVPTAAFTASVAELTASVDASGSTDADGTITAYAWTFGDGNTATGVTASRTYAVAGTYPVTLTVTDDQGATATTSKQVTVTAPPNQAPVALFTSSSADLELSVDGSSSTDPDGSVAAHAWTFGDGGTATGANATHTYATTGTYAVTLTVTDDDGRTATTSRQVTISAPPQGAVAWDTFERTVTGGFGSAAVGGPWTTTSGIASVSAGRGQLLLAQANSSGVARLPGVEGSALVTRVSTTLDKRPNGSGGTVIVRGRITTVGDYRLKLGFKSSGAVTARLMRTNTAGTETALTAETTVAGLTYTAGTVINVRLEVTGTSPTTIRAAVWGSGAEPAAALLTATDATTGLQVAGHTGVAALLSSSSSNGPVAVRFDDFVVTAG